MPYSVKGFFEINEDMVQILLMLEVLFTQDSKVEDLFCGVSSGSEPSLFFSNYFFSLGFKSIQDDFQHDFARPTDEADSSVILTELQVALERDGLRQAELCPRNTMMMNTNNTLIPDRSQPGITMTASWSISVAKDMSMGLDFLCIRTLWMLS